MVNAHDSKYVTESSTGHIWSPEDRPQLQTQEPGSFPKPFRAERNPEGQAGGWWADSGETACAQHGKTGRLQESKRSGFPVPSTPRLRAIPCGHFHHPKGPSDSRFWNYHSFPWSLPAPVQAARCLFADHLSGLLHSGMRHTRGCSQFSGPVSSPGCAGPLRPAGSPTLAGWDLPHCSPSPLPAAPTSMASSLVIQSDVPSHLSCILRKWPP